MSTTSLLIQNMTELFTLSSSIMDGGKLNKNMNNVMYESKQKNILIIILSIIVFILIKGLIVYLLYNFMMPKLIYSLSENKSLEIIESNFKTLTFSESVLLAILANVLFSSF
jgi:cytochrome b subunit of formate dehydrogenase